MGKHFIIYKTTNLVNGRFYIGMHVTTKIDDGYLGSGHRIKAEIKKYGRENFKREVLEELPSKDEMVRREAELVTEELRSDPLCLNLKNGGEGGWDQSARSSDDRRCGMMKANQKIWSNKSFIEAHKERQRQRAIAGEFSCSGGFTGKRHREETKVKMSERHQHNSHQVGEANSQFGTKWITNGTVSIKAKAKDLDAYFAAGYRLGRTIPK